MKNEVPSFQIRPAVRSDLERLAQLRAFLWPLSRKRDHEAELKALLEGASFSTMPLEIFVAESGDGLLGFVEVGLRSHADGCDPSKPVGYIEGWYVDAEHRKGRIGRALFEVAENWARKKGCLEMASDTWVDNLAAQKAHEALGFIVVDRCVNYKKAL